MPTLVHLVYIHGFQGNDTTFQSFPKHLQEHLSSNIPQNLDITIQSSLYPTYKSVKPISHATKNFLEWLSTQPPGPVILMGHSMGGLLAAEAATDAANNSAGGRPKRIIGVAAFDTPYLGMHPHVVITGISSLLPKGEEEKGKEARSERAMNQHPQVQIVDPKVTDDWEAFKKQAHIRLPKDNARLSGSSSHLSLQDTSPSPLRATSRSPSPSSQLVDRAISFIGAHSDESVARWLQKHSDDPVSAAKRWVVEHLQFGICMFDPSGLKARYTRLVGWEAEGGMWANYWTYTASPASAASTPSARDQIEHDKGLQVNGVLPPADVSPLPSARPALKQPNGSSAPSKKKAKQGRHFIVLPNGLGSVLGGMEKWEQVPVAGVDDEVNAHTGIFIPQKNLEYDAFVKRVADRILGWCQRLQTSGNRH